MKRLQCLFPVGAVIASLLFFASCSKNGSTNNSSNQPRLEVRLTDRPDPNVKEVWIDIREVNIIMDDSSNPTALAGSHPGLYNLLAFANGKDTVLANALIPAGTISQIRMV